MSSHAAGSKGQDSSANLPGSQASADLPSCPASADLPGPVSSADLPLPDAMPICRAAAGRFSFVCLMMALVHILAGLVCAYTVRQAGLLDWSPVKLLKFIPEHSLLWRQACFFTSCASMSFVIFVVCARDVLDRRAATLATLAVVFVTIAAACDLNGLFSMMVLFSDLSAQFVTGGHFMVHETYELAWATLDQALSQCLLIGNTLYSLAGVMVVCAGALTKSFPKWLVWSGMVIWAVTLVVSLLSFLGLLKWVLIISMAAALIFVLWSLALCLVYFRLSRRA